MKNIGKAIRQLRKKHGFSQSDLGRVMGMERARISHVENDKPKDYRYSTLEAFAKAFGITVVELIELAPEMEE